MGKTLDIIDSFPIKAKIKEANRNLVMSDSGSVRDNVSLVCRIAATHAGTLINNRIYPPKSMKKGIKSWTTPYKKPVLVNGQVENREYLCVTFSFDHDIVDGAPAARFVQNLTNLVEGGIFLDI